MCLITGSAGGLGRAVGEALARRGATVLLSARDPAKAAAAAARPAGEGAGALRSLPADLDVADAGSVDAAARAVADLTGRLDVLVNNAAAYVDWGETATGADLAASRAVMETNLYGTWRMIQAFLPLLRRSDHPRIVNVASGAGSHGDTQYGLAARHGAAASYGISKAAVLALTATVAAELDGTPVIVNAVDPDLTATWPGARGHGRPAGAGQRARHRLGRHAARRRAARRLLPGRPAASLVTALPAPARAGGPSPPWR